MLVFIVSFYTLQHEIDDDNNNTNTNNNNNNNNSNNKNIAVLKQLY